MDQSSPVTALEKFEGRGKLRCRHGRTWGCEFAIIRLLNGRLQVRVVPDARRGSSAEWSERLKGCQPFAVEGEDGQGTQLSAKGIDFTRTVFSLSEDRDTLIGYTESAARRRHGEPAGAVMIECELSNFRATSSAYPVSVQVEGHHLEIGRLGWRGSGDIDEHSNAYRHSTVSAYLRIQGVPMGEEDQATQLLHKISSLLSIAGRGHVFFAACHRFDGEKQWAESQYFEPVFTDRGWPRPLIPGESLGEFLVAAYPLLVARHRSFEVGNVLDHYLQALTLRSAWPLSLGIFTAMETLRAAFFRQTDVQASQFWVAPEEFEAKEGMLEDLVAVLVRHFPSLGKLKSGEMDSLKRQFAGISRRSYKHQLRTMLKWLGVSYTGKELQAFVDIRNTIIHQGVPVPGGVCADEYERGTARRWQRIQAAARLFERALLGVLGYTGPRELFYTSDEANQNG